uniref:recombinase family protein n=1 Tax=Acetatifactor sp. TaxID=1872090 RepID=UPI00405752CA
MGMIIGLQLNQKQSRRLRAVIYNRCSTEKEVQENAIVIQEQESIRACEEHDWEIVHIYKELESGTYADIRDEYQQLLRDIKLDKFDIIVVKCQDRIMRNLGDWCQFVDLINEYDIQLYFYMENKFYDYENDELVYGFTMQMHAFYSKNLAIKIKQSHKTRQSTLSHPNINEIYGWNRVDMYTFVINEVEAGYIRRGYELLRAGHGFHTIANILYDEGARSKRAGLTYKDRKSKKIKYYNEKIPSSTWRKILYSTNMYGTVILNKNSKPLGKRKRINNPEEDWVYFENALPPIVTKEYYEETIAMHQNSMKVQNCSLKDYDRSISMIGKHEWSSKLTCDCCGSKFYRMKVKRKNREEYEIKWRCSKIKDNGEYSEDNTIGCRNIIIEEVRFKELISAAIEKQFGYITNNIDRIIETVLSNIRSIFNEDDVENELLGIQAEIVNQNKKKSVLFEKLMSELISDADFKVYNEKLDTEISRLTEREHVLKDRCNTYNDYDARLSEIRNVLEKNIIKQVGADKIIKSIGNIRIYPSGKCEVHFNKEMLYKLLKIYNDDIMGKQLDCMLDFEFIYNKPTVYEKRRAEVNQLVLDTFRKNPHLTIQGVADKLNEKYSYIYTSVAMLRKENKLQYKQLNFEHDGIWIVQPEVK